jgi:hypothetical protein
MMIPAERSFQVFSPLNRNQNMWINFVRFANPNEDWEAEDEIDRLLAENHNAKYVSEIKFYHGRDPVTGRFARLRCNYDFVVFDTPTDLLMFKMRWA